MLFYQTVDTGTLELLKRLQALEPFQPLRLVGGTALALQYGHRRSIDLDLFGRLDLATWEVDQWVGQVCQAQTIRNSAHIHVYMMQGVKVDIVNYPYPWIDSMVFADGLRLAGIRDIAAMKLAAITGRGSKKDFVDLHCLLQHMQLTEMLDCYSRKYPDGSVFLVLKSLVYFEDAEQDPMPDMLTNHSWPEIKDSILEAYKIYVR